MSAVQNKVHEVDEKTFERMRQEIILYINNTKSNGKPHPEVVQGVIESIANSLRVSFKWYVPGGAVVPKQLSQKKIELPEEAQRRSRKRTPSQLRAFKENCLEKYKKNCQQYSGMFSLPKSNDAKKLIKYALNNSELCRGMFESMCRLIFNSNFDFIIENEVKNAYWSYGIEVEELSKSYNTAIAKSISYLLSSRHDSVGGLVELMGKIVDILDNDALDITQKVIAIGEILQKGIVGYAKGNTKGSKCILFHRADNNSGYVHNEINPDDSYDEVNPAKLPRVASPLTV